MGFHPGGNLLESAVGSLSSPTLPAAISRRRFFDSVAVATFAQKDGAPGDGEFLAIPPIAMVKEKILRLRSGRWMGYAAVYPLSDVAGGSGDPLDSRPGGRRYQVTDRLLDRDQKTHMLQSNSSMAATVILW